jgi:hypothetical protein
MAAPEPEPEYLPPWPPGRRAVAAMVWSAFLAACLGSLLGFAWLDPADLLDGGYGADWLTPTAIYTLGFFLFFVVGFAGAFLGVYLTRPPA